MSGHAKMSTHTFCLFRLLQRRRGWIGHLGNHFPPGGLAVVFESSLLPAFFGIPARTPNTYLFIDHTDGMNS